MIGPSARSVRRSVGYRIAFPAAAGGAVPAGGDEGRRSDATERS